MGQQVSSSIPVAPLAATSIRHTVSDAALQQHCFHQDKHRLPCCIHADTTAISHSPPIGPVQHVGTGVPRGWLGRPLTDPAAARPARARNPAPKGNYTGPTTSSQAGPHNDVIYGRRMPGAGSVYAQRRPTMISTTPCSGDSSTPRILAGWLSVAP